MTERVCVCVCVCVWSDGGIILRRKKRSNYFHKYQFQCDIPQKSNAVWHGNNHGTPEDFSLFLSPNNTNWSSFATEWLRFLEVKR